MFEIILSSVKTGRVVRKVFDSREQADEAIDRYFQPAPTRLQGRNRRDYRVEVYHRPLPVVRSVRPTARRTVSASPAA
jgi:hypothetical protein